MARSLKQRVAAGAKFLDKKAPNWFKKVKRTKLAMHSNEMCVLGQLGNGDAWAYAGKIGLDLDVDDEKYGFQGEGEGEGHDQLWAEEIKSRLDGEAPAEKKQTAPKKKDKK